MKTYSFHTDVLPLKNQLFRLALRITLDRGDAEDVVQDTMLKVWNRREQWDRIDSMEAFCLTICRNLALDKVRRMKSQPQEAAPPTAQMADNSPSANPEEQAVQRDRVRLLRQLISQLPEKQRTCIHLRDFEGKSYKDIAAIMDITEQQVKVNIHRARQTVKERFYNIDSK